MPTPLVSPLKLAGTALYLLFWPALILRTLLLAVRIVDEEKLLSPQLKGYDDYRRQGRHRLVPLLW